MKKFLIVLCFTMLFVLGSVSAFAWTTPTTSNHYFVFQRTDGIIKYYTANSSNLLRVNSWGISDSTTDNTGGGYLYYWDTTTNLWVSEGFSTYLNWGGTSTVLASNYDIYNYVTNSVFFSVPPVPTPTPVPPLTLQQLQQQSGGNLLTSFGQNLGVLLPIGVAVLAILLLPALIPRLLRLFL